MILVDREGFDKILASLKGKIVVVDFWATWCPHCVEMFPHTVQLSRAFEGSNVAFVSVSMDEPDDRTRVIEFLNHQQADFDNLISSYGLGSEGFTKFEITNSVLPHFKIYDGNGELKHSCDSNQDLEVKIRSLLEH